MGAWNSVANMAISVAKALLIALFFTHLRQAGALLRIAALTGLVCWHCFSASAGPTSAPETMI